MNRLLSKSIQLRRFHVAILVIVASFCGWTMSKYIAITRAKFEQLVFTTSLSNIRNMFTVNSVLKQVTDPQCHFLDDPNLFNEKLNMLPVLNPSESAKKSRFDYWKYDNKRHRLIYNLESNQYFQSTIGPHIILDFTCKKGNVQVKISPHRWCKDMSIWGCSTY